MIGLHHSICSICNYKRKEWLEENDKVGWRHCRCKEEEE